MGKAVFYSENSVMSPFVGAVAFQRESMMKKDSVFHRQQHLHILKIHEVCAPIFRGVFSCRCLISVS